MTTSPPLTPAQEERMGAFLLSVAQWLYEHPEECVQDETIEVEPNKEVATN